MSNPNRHPARRQTGSLLPRLFLAGSMLATPGLASTIDVAPGSAYSGAAGLAVTLGSACASPDLVDLSAPTTPALDGVYEACQRLTAADTAVVAASTLRAGQSVALGSGFSVAAGAGLAVEIDRSLSQLAWVEDRSLFQEIRYTAVFQQRLDGLVLTDGDEVHHLVGYSADGEPQFRIVIERDTAEGKNLLSLAAREDGGGWVETPVGQEEILPAGWNEIRVEWKAGDGDGDGELTVAVNGAAAFPGLTGLDNDTARLDSIRWGAADGSSIDGTPGTMDLDDFDSWR